MNQPLEEFLAAGLAKYEVVTHPEAFTAQEQASTAHVSGWSWAKSVVSRRRRTAMPSSPPAASSTSAACGA
jgi:hypothetical protein